MSTYQGPAEGNAAYFFGSTVGLEVSVPNGTPSLSPAFAPFVDYTGGSQITTPINKAIIVNGNNIQFSSPA